MLLTLLTLAAIICSVSGQLRPGCPQRSCLNQCEYGFDSDISGCLTCNCKLNPAFAPSNSYRAGTCTPIYRIDSQVGASCTSTCRSDQECSVNQKCCSNGFCNRCQPLSSVGPRPGTTRPGQCPVVQPGQTLGSCTNECTYDSECSYPTQKCCYNGCGRTCTYVSTTGVPGVPGVIVPTIKPGVCPGVTQGQFGICVNQCTSDAECPNTQKCCSNGCGTVCSNVITTGFPTYPGVPYPSYPTYPVGVPTTFPNVYPNVFPNYPGYPNTGYPYPYPGAGFPTAGYPNPGYLGVGIGGGYPYPGLYPPYPAYPGLRYSPVVPNSPFYPRFAAVEDANKKGAEAAPENEEDEEEQDGGEAFIAE